MTTNDDVRIDIINNDIFNFNSYDWGYTFITLFKYE